MIHEKWQSSQIHQQKNLIEPWSIELAKKSVKSQNYKIRHCEIEKIPKYADLSNIRFSE